MDLRTLQTFLTIYEQKNLHRASDLLFITQQGLSRTLRSLEKELDCTLFLRTSAGLIPTKQADRFYDSAVRIVHEMDTLQQDLRSLSGETSPIHLPCSYGTLHRIYPDLQRFQEIHPEIPLNWSEYPDLTVDAMLNRQESPLILTVCGDNQESFHMLPLFSEGFVILVHEGHPYYTVESLTLTDLHGIRLILEGRQFHVYHNFVQACSREQIHPRIVAETTEIGLCISLCRMKEGIALVPESVSRSYRLEGLRAIPLNAEHLTFSSALAYKEGTPLPISVQKFLDFIQEDSNFSKNHMQPKKIL